MKTTFLLILVLILNHFSFSQVEVEESSNSDTLEFKKLDVEPEFPGGDAARIKYIMDNIFYPAQAREMGIQGTVHLTFVIEKDGSITNVRILRGIGGGCDEEVIRLIKGMPNWIPGSIDGENVRAQFNMPIKFTLDGGGSIIYDNTKLDKPAQFPKGKNAFDKYLKENLEYPKKAIKKNIQGEIIAKFNVSETGNIHYVRIEKGLDKKCDKAVVEFLENMPDWEVAQYNGEDVIASVEMIFVFELINNKPNIIAAVKRAKKQTDKDIEKMPDIDFNDPVIDEDEEEMDLAIEPENDLDEIKKPTDEEHIFVFVEDQPSFVGGDEAMRKFITENIKYPEGALENGIEGTVYITFVVEKDGSLTNVKVMRGIGGGCDEEAIRVIKSMPKWKPGKQRGKEVRTQFNIPVKFVLEK